MHPVLFKIPWPDFLPGPDHLTVHSYGFFIALGILAAYTYASWRAKKEMGISQDTITSLLIYIVIAAVVGGKVFTWFENPRFYFSDPANLLKNFSSGFVFYGSLIFAIPTMLFFFKKHKIPVLQMLDIIAITAPIVHAFGRFGCFMAGCCHGIPTDSFLGITFSDPHCAAYPKDMPLHPTQLYSVLLLLLIILILSLIKSRKQFHGQLFLIYLALYAIGRSIIEIFRGDEGRGYVIEDFLSNSQFISLFVIAGVIYFYFRLQKRQNKKVKQGEAKATSQNED
ncbi:MAG: prolipoprotein diacylglyceryl transferase [Bacteroidetes bacterium]|nr:prolipoprotein diacylglyceryl transferase [Bacteroidota bacterium]